MAPECVEMYLRLILRFLVREFESVETFPGFARFLIENWVKGCQCIHDVGKT